MKHDVNLVPYPVEVFEGNVSLFYGLSYFCLVVRMIAVRRELR